jgi:hypothetical protein
MLLGMLRRLPLPFRRDLRERRVCLTLRAVDRREDSG